MKNPQKTTHAPKIWQAETPFKQLPMLPPNVELESRTILKRCIQARVSLAELKKAGELIPNQGILINSLPLLEAQASSEIENIVTTTDQLFQFRDEDANADAATIEALRYSRALLKGYRTLQNFPLTTRTAEEICTQIKGVEMQVRRVPGTALARAPTGEIVYTPPVGEEFLRASLANWERFLHNETNLDPLVRMAVGHYQFEAIHPFTDGNGRTGRILNSLFLISQDLLTLPTLYLSRFIIQRKSDYYRLLLEVTQKAAWEEWILFMLQGVEETSQWTVKKIEAIRELQSQTIQYVKNVAPQIYSHELLNLIFEMPYCRIQNVTERQIVGRQTASSYLKELVKHDVLIEKVYGREKLFINPRLMKLLTQDTNAWAPFHE